MWIIIVNWFVISGLLYTVCQLLPHTYITYKGLSRQHCISSGIEILISHHLHPRKSGEDKTAPYSTNFGEPAQPLWFPQGIAGLISWSGCSLSIKERLEL